MSKTWRRVLDPNAKIRDLRAYGNHNWKTEAEKEVAAMSDTFYIVVNLFTPEGEEYEIREDLSFWRSANAAYDEFFAIARELDVSLQPDDEDFYTPGHGPDDREQDYYYIEEAEFSG